MHKYKQEIAALNELLESWATAFEGYRAAGQPTLELTSSGDAGGTGVEGPEVISTNYAVSVVMDTRGRLLELIDTYEAKWPHEASWCEEERSRWPLGKYSVMQPSCWSARRMASA